MPFHTTLPGSNSTMSSEFIVYPSRETIRYPIREGFRYPIREGFRCPNGEPTGYPGGELIRYPGGEPIWYPNTEAISCQSGLEVEPWLSTQKYERCGFGDVRRDESFPWLKPDDPPNNPDSLPFDKSADKGEETSNEELDDATTSDSLKPEDSQDAGRAKLEGQVENRKKVTGMGSVEISRCWARRGGRGRHQGCQPPKTEGAESRG
ncbi:hypothetical protein BGZ63DRAFT_406033 [Mariannaea sp. PMI_226]|nr:hypothetical protein BGZ63DRAFT_406033 [Mariannaea sp. PMI_226]